LSRKIGWVFIIFTTKQNQKKKKKKNKYNNKKILNLPLPLAMFLV
jgi:hypothetical protein